MPTRRTFLNGFTAAATAAAVGPRALAQTQAQFPASLPMVLSRLRYERKQSPLMTRWSADVDPKNPLPEYPRPQIVRREWLSLNGLWEYQPGGEKDATPVGKTLTGAILVPYPVESALSGVMEHHDRLWYRRQLTVPDRWKGKTILLHFGAVDYEAEVYVNGQSLGVHTGGYDAFHLDITAALAGKSTAELIVRVFDPTQMGGQPRGKQNSEPRGITYTPTTGIWQTVWLEAVPSVYIEDMTITPDIDRGVLKVSVTAPESRAATLGVVVRAAGAVIAKTSGALTTEVKIPNAHLWTPDDPFLYDLELTLRAGATEDRVTSYFAMRKSSIGPSGPGGDIKLLLNNQFVFQAGPLDQGFWPDGIYTPPTDDAIRNEIAQMKAMGFNFVRKHIKVEPARWYYWCDTLGLMVWQDMPSCNSYPSNQPVRPAVDKAAYTLGLERMVKQLKNVPAIVMWVTFNENQGQFDTQTAVELVRSIDPSRVINEASGGAIFGFGDVNDVHSYPEPAVHPSNGKQAMVCGEFGGIGFIVKPHMWQPNGSSYIVVDTTDDLLYTYAEYFRRVHDLRDHKNLSAVVYTELTDVMTEVNGLLCYDRTAKLPAAKLKQATLGTLALPTYRFLVPTSQTAGQPWKYTTTKPVDGWNAAAFDDGSWQTGNAPFADSGAGTEWKTQDIWLRRSFHPGAISAKEVQNLVFAECYRSRVEFFLNGVALSAQQDTSRTPEDPYELRPLPEVVRRAVRPSAENVIAVHVHLNPKDTVHLFDAGLAIRIPA